MTTEIAYDSEKDTLDHIGRVRELLALVRDDLFARMATHDVSKLHEPEKSIFDAVTPKLRGMTYGSDEYKASLAEMKPALDHHYANNSHHPEHYRWFCPVCSGHFNDATYEDAPQGPNDTGVRFCPDCSGPGVVYETELMLKPEQGINGMTLLDVVEMFCDWKAATERHADGSLQKSIQINHKRFQMSSQLTQIFENTRKALDW